MNMIYQLIVLQTLPGDCLKENSTLVKLLFLSNCGIWAIVL